MENIWFKKETSSGTKALMSSGITYGVIAPLPKTNVSSLTQYALLWGLVFPMSSINNGKLPIEKIVMENTVTDIDSAIKSADEIIRKGILQLIGRLKVAL